jgi:pectate lyase
VASASHRRSLRKRRAPVVSAAVVAAGVGAGALLLSANAASAVDLYHQTLAAKDGRASSGSGTTGGAKADSTHTFTVSTRAQLVKALGSVSDTTELAKTAGAGVLTAN